MWISRKRYDRLRARRDYFQEAMDKHYKRWQVAEEQAKELKTEIVELKKLLEKPKRYIVTGDRVSETVTAFSVNTYMSGAILITAFYDQDRKIIFQTPERVTFRLIENE